MRATHNGTCQVCGRQHANSRNGLAKHGYTTQWGFFAGTCGGSDRNPLEISTDLLDRTCQKLSDAAEKKETATDATTLGPVKVEYRDAEDVNKYGERKRKTALIATLADYQEWLLDNTPSPMMTWQQLCERSLALHKFAAKSMRKHVAGLLDLKLARHGKPLFERSNELPDDVCKGSRQAPKEGYARRRYAPCAVCNKPNAVSSMGRVRQHKATT